MKQITDSEIATIEGIIATIKARGDIPEPTMPVAQFTANVTSGTAPLTVKFTNTSQNATSYLWRFGDGTTSTAVNPTVVYAVGTYTVTLIATNSIGTNTMIKTDMIVVNASQLPVPNFTTNVTSGSSPLSVKFTNTTTNATSYLWNFGNGQTSTATNPIVTYAAGVYTITLKATNAAGTATMVKQNMITVTELPSSVYLLSSYAGFKFDGSNESATYTNALKYAASHGYTKVSYPTNGIIGVSAAVEYPPGLEHIGNGCTIRLVNNASLDHEGAFIYTHAGGYIHHLIFDGNMTNQGGTATNGVMVYENTEFAYNEVKNVGAYTVFTYLSDYAYIHDNIIHDSWQYGISTGGTTTPYEVGIRIQNNTIYNCEEVGIKIKGADGAVISGNTVTMPTKCTYPSEYGQNATPIGIHLYSADEPNKNCVIDGNTVIGVIGAYWNQGIGSSNQLNPGCKIINNIVKTVINGINVKFNNGTITGNTVTYYNTGIVNSGSNNTINNNTQTKL